MAEIDLPHLVKVLKPIWTTKTETATRVRQRIESVLAWATVNKFHSGDNPARWKGNLEHALPKPSKVKRVEHHAALPWQEIGTFMADLRKRDGIGARALEFAILTAARSGEVRGATWDEIDLKAKLWTIPASRMKANKTHRVPLSEPAIKLLKALPRFEGSPYVFPAVRGRMLSDMSISAVTRRMGAAVVPHGFRSTFKDWCRSSTAYPDEVSELAMAHVNNDATRAAYARDELLPQRQRLMAEWARYCGTMPSKGKVVPISRRSDENSVAFRTEMSDTYCPMKGSEFIRKVQRLAKERGLACRVDEKRGKGSHVTLYFGDHLTIVRNPKDELKTGTLHAMCKQLGISRDEL